MQNVVFVVAANLHLRHRRQFSRVRGANCLLL